MNTAAPATNFTIESRCFICDTIAAETPGTNNNRDAAYEAADAALAAHMNTHTDITVWDAVTQTYRPGVWTPDYFGGEFR